MYADLCGSAQRAKKRFTAGLHNIRQMKQFLWLAAALQCLLRAICLAWVCAAWEGLWWLTAAVPSFQHAWQKASRGPVWQNYA